MRNVLNTQSGVVAALPEHLANHVILRKYLLEVPEGTKSLVPGMFKPGTAEEFAELNAKTEDKATADSDEEGDK